MCDRVYKKLGSMFIRLFLKCMFTLDKFVISLFIYIYIAYTIYDTIIYATKYF